MTATPDLLSLPRELRDNIWHYAFTGHEVTPTSTFASEASLCLACDIKPPQTTVYHQAYIPLLTCKQIHGEALILFRKSLSLRITSLRILRSLTANPKHPLSTSIHSLILDLHMDDDNREDWMASLAQVSTTFPQLTNLTINNHMRPPVGYDALIDGIHLAGPIANFPPHLAYPKHTAINFAYIVEAVMFENAFLGVVRVSDALEEHEGVIRDLLADEHFATASKVHDLHRMTNCLLRIARAHEQPWLEALQRRRREEVRMAWRDVE